MRRSQQVRDQVAPVGRRAVARERHRRAHDEARRDRRATPRSPAASRRGSRLERGRVARNPRAPPRAGRKRRADSGRSTSADPPPGTVARGAREAEQLAALRVGGRELGILRILRGGLDLAHVEHGRRRCGARPAPPRPAALPRIRSTPRSLTSEDGSPRSHALQSSAPSASAPSRERFALTTASARRSGSRRRARC